MTYGELLGTLLVLLVVLVVFAHRIDTRDTTEIQHVRSFARGMEDVGWIFFGSIFLVLMLLLLYSAHLLSRCWKWFWFGEQSTKENANTPWMSP